MQDAPGSELFTILDMLDFALGMKAGISVEEKGPATYVVSAVVEQLRAWGRKKVIFRIDGIRVLGVAIQHVDRTPSHDTFSRTLSSLCTRHIVSQGVARRVCIKDVHVHVITCLSVYCFFVLSSSSVSRASTFSRSSTCSLS